MSSLLQQAATLRILWRSADNRLSRLPKGSHANAARSGFQFGGRAPDRGTSITCLRTTTHA
eukprot:4304296-Prorocentrum_lima.AAC.1